MRPRYLEIEGLQSFNEVQKIDFDRLNKTGLFGIFGPTGSGKSTILDAITLALYGKVHRANMGTQGIINLACDSVRVSFLFDLLKNDKRKTYRVERVYNKKKGSEISCEAKIVRLIEIDGNVEIPLGDKLTDVNKKIEELLGLKHDDFTKAVVLPQNQFQEFLLLEKSKKREMLERIFYLEEYGKQLNTKLSIQLSQAKMRLSNIQGALSTLGDASKDALKETLDVLQRTETDRRVAVEEFSSEEIKYTELKELWHLTEELRFIKNKIKKHLETSEEILKKKELLDKAQKAEGLVVFINNYKDITKKLNKTEKQLKIISNGMPQLKEELENTKSLYEQKLKEWEIEKPELVKRNTELHSALELNKEISELDKKIILLEEELLENEKEISINRKKIDDKNNGIVAIEKNIKKYNQDIEDLKVDSGYKKEIQDGLKLENDLTFVLEGYDKLNVEKTELEKLVDKLGKALSTIKIQVNETEEKLKLLDLIIEKHEKSRPGERDDVTELIKIYHKHKSIIGLIRSKEKDLNAIVEKINTKTKLIDRHKKSQKAIGLNYKDTKFKVDSLTQEMTLLKMQIEKDTAYVISKNLKDGEPCPVCGSKDHPSPANLVISELDMDISNNIRELEDKFEESELEYKAYEASLKEIEKKQMYINEQIRNEDEQVTQLKVDLEEKEREIWKLKEDLSDEIRPLTTELAEKEIEKINDIANKKQNEIEQWEEMFNNLKERKRKGDEILNNYKVEEGKADSQLGVNKENLTKVTTDIKNNFQILNKKDKLYKEFLDKHSIIKVASELERIADNERRIEKLRELTKQQGEDVKNLEKDRDALQKKRQNLENQFAQLEAEHKYVNENKNEKRIKVKELGGEFNVEDEIKLVEKELSDIGKQEKKLSELLSKLSNSFGSVSIEKNTLESQQKIYKEDFERDQARLNLSLQDKGFNTPEEAEEFLLKKEKQIGLRDEINEYERVERNLSAQKDLLLKKVDGNSITEEEWNKVCHIYKEKAELKDKAISQYEVAKNNYERTKEKHKEWVTLNKENNTLSKKMNMLEQIKSLLRGNSFIDFVAEERLRYIAAESTEILGELTNFRYALELDTDMGFVIRDNANGGIHRMVASLSGGETFIASLSLALALSKQMQLKGQSPLEFFFLDEGFGTLDRDLLDVVIDALQKISTEDRAIGLISHVPELRNRIGRRLIVEPPTAEGRGSRINMEKA